jgi:hypothetical protein
MSILHLLDRPIAFHRIFAQIAGSAAGGVFLSQAVYWSNRLADDRAGWFWKTQAEWEAETCLTRKEQESIRKQLRQIGVLEEKRQGQPALLWFRLNEKTLESLILYGSVQYAQKGHTRVPVSDILECPKGADLNAQKGHTRVPVSDILECPKGADYLYTETTIRDYSQRLQSETTIESPQHQNFNPEKLAEEEVNHPLTTIEPEIVNPAKKAKSSKEDNLSAADFELFRQTWNEFKPQTFGFMRSIGPERKKTIVRVIREFGSFEATLEGLEAALTFARSDSWAQTLNLDFENVASNNKLIAWSERATAARPLEPSTAKRAVTTYNRLAALEDVEPITPRHLLNSNS